MKSTWISIILMGAGAHAIAAGGASWLNYPRSARNVAEAGGLGVMAQGTDSLGLNVAGLASMQGKGQVAISHSSWAADIRSENLGLAFRGPLGGVASLGGTWVDFGGIQGYRLGSSGVEATQVLRPSAGAAEAAWAFQWPGSSLKLGIGAGMLMQDLDGSHASMTASFEAGASLDGPMGLRVAAAADHLGGELDGSALPSHLRLGLAWGREGVPLELGVEVSNQGFDEAAPDLAAALRARLAGPLTARLGWQQLNGQSGSPSVGLSFSPTGRWDLDYAFRDQTGFGSTHHVGLSLRWG